MASNLYFRSILLAASLFTAHVAVRAQSMGNWSNTGPTVFPTNVSGQIHGIGRVSQIKFHPTNSAKVYAVSASGGVYTTTNNGVSWSPMSGTETLPQTSLSSICINYSNDQTLYLCLGDANYYSNYYGIYKSTNGGASWAASNSGISTNMAVEILMDPADTNKLVAATKGGIYRTTNGGASWSLIQSGTFRDMKKNPATASRTLFAATGSAFYYSTDFGATWTAGTGFTVPTSNVGMRIAVSAADTSRVYLVTTGGYGVVYKSTNSGISFSTVFNSTTKCIVCYDSAITSTSQGDYNIDLTANPANANELLLVAHNVWRSTDAGTTWSQRTMWYNVLHTDMHHIEWNPYNNAQVWTANDGGVWMSTDTNARLWSSRADGIAATECYHAAQSPVVRDLISIGTQDNGELYYTSGTWKTNRGGDWSPPCAIDYTSTGRVWYPIRGNRRSLLPLGSDVSFNAPYTTSSGTFVSGDTTRIEFVKTLTTVAFAGNDSIYRCSNTAAVTPAWTLIKPNTVKLLDIESCRADSNILYILAGTNTLWRTDNALATTPTWTTLITSGTITSTSSVATWAYNSNVVFVSCGISIYRSTDKGVTWSNITGTGLSGLNIRKIICDDYSTKQRLFVNDGVYVHYKDSTTTTWTNHSSTAGLPSVANVTDFMIYNDGTSQSILRLATYGRGVWQCNINNNVAPTPDFTANKTNVCTGDTVTFTQAVVGAYTSLSWAFTGGTPSASTATSPVIVYNTPGVYAVTLSATNAYGTNSITKTAFITVSNGLLSPVTEGFESTTYPPSGWSLSNNSGLDWAQTSAVSGFGGSTKSIVWDNYNTDAAGAHDKIISPSVSLVGVKAGRLKFDVAYAPYSTSYPDSLQVKVSTDCGRTWSTIYNKTGTALGTASAYTAATFVPTSSQWRSDSVSLTPYVGQSVKLSFENIGHYGQTLYLDNINIKMSPIAAFGKSVSGSFCAGKSVTFTDLSTNATSWSWSFPGGTPSTSTSQNPVVTYGTAGTYNATLIVTNSTGSDTLTKTGYIVVTTGVTVNLGRDTTLCPGQSITLNAGNTGAAYLYSTLATTQSITVSTAGAYSVLVTDVLGCTGRDTIVVTTASNPVVNLGADTTLCPGATITLNAGNSGSSFLYSNSATSQSTAITSAGIYSVRVTNASACVGRDTIVISAGTNPVVNLGADTAICPGVIILLDAGNTGSSFLYNTNATTQGIYIGAAGTYSVRVTNAQGCIGRDTIVVTVAPTPVVNLGRDTTLCAGASITLNAGNPGNSFLYSTSATTQTITVSTAGTYSVRVTNAQGCVGRDTVIIGTSANPSVSLGNDTTLCPGTSITLNAGAGYSSYLYSNTTATQSTTITSAGTYSVRVTNVAGCIGRDTIVVSAASNPVVNLGNDTTVCPGATITLNAGNSGSAFLYNTSATTQSISVTSGATYSVRVTNAQGCIGRDTIVIAQGVNPVVNLGNDTTLCPAASITLNAGNSGSTFLYSNAATTQTTTVTSSGTYSVRVTNAGGCIGRDTIIIASATAPAVSLGADTAICPGATITLNAANTGSLYLWSNSATTQTVSVTAGGTFRVQVTNAQGCIGRDTIIIAQGINPTVALGADTILCPGTAIALNAGNTGGTYLWSTTATTQSIPVTTSGTYIVRVTNAQACVGRDTIVITAGTAPVVALGRDTTICPGVTITLNAGNAGSSYLWSTSSTTQSISVTAAGSYYVRVMNAQHCVGVDTVVVSIGAIPSAPITISGSLLTAGSAGASYQWLRNGVAIPGATSASYRPTLSGSYTVIVTSAEGCTGTSPEFVFTPSGVSGTALGAGFVVFPNPTTGVFTLSGEGFKAGIVTLNCYNAVGSLIRREVLKPLGGRLRETLDWGMLAAGIYGLSLTGDNGLVLHATLTIR